MKFCQEITNKGIWEDFLLRCEEKTFLQSWNWGEFQKMMGNKIWRLGIFDDHRKLISLALVIKIAAKRGTFLLIQHGPIIKSQISNLKSQILEVLLNKLKEITKEEGVSFIRMIPLWERNEENQKLLKSFGFRKAPMHANTYEATLKLDLLLSEEELLKQFRKTTRYLIRRALKNPELEIFKSNRIEDVKLHDDLIQRVAKHQKFIPFSFRFVKNQFYTFSRDDQVLLFLGKYREKIIASALVIFWSGIGFYHQAALDPKWHKVPISYLLQWEAIKEAKRRGCRLYDFWGFVDPKKYPNHPWAGPTLFKLGFGGRIFEYVETQDLPLSGKYWLIYIFEKLRKIKRGL